jgi:hypothetical protein
MSVTKEKKLVDYSKLNGTYKLQGSDFCRIQWYPMCQLFYYIINDKPAVQGAMPAKRMIKMLKNHSPGFVLPKLPKKEGGE